MQPAGNTLYLVAGMPGSGKSTIIEYCLKNSVPLFGKADGGFLEFSGKKAAADQPLEARIANMVYVEQKHLDQLVILELAQPVLMHVDILNTLKFVEHGGLEALSSDYCQQLFHRRFSALFLKFDRIATVTLVCDFGTARVRVAQRNAQKKESFFRLVYDRIGKRPGRGKKQVNRPAEAFYKKTNPEVFSTITSGWIKFAQEVSDCHFVYRYNNERDTYVLARS